MGARFEVAHVNLIGYLTGGRNVRAPRTDVRTLETFLWSLAHNNNLISSTEGTPEDWRRQVASIAQNLLSIRIPAIDPLVSEIVDVRPILDPLRPYFSDYDFYALVLPKGDWYKDRESFRFFMEAAVSSHAAGLVLMPESSGFELSQFMDPFPALQVLSEHPLPPPAVVFWTRLGGACACPLDEALIFLRTILLGAVSGGLHAANEAIAAHARRRRTKKILHLSDIHIGRPEAMQRCAWLKQHLFSILPNVDRVVVTGDLFDTPSKNLRASFDEFLNDLRRQTSEDVLVIPGNHDVRKKGNAFERFGQNFKYVADLEWKRVVPDDNIEAFFFSFNSSEEGNFATGLVSKQQRINVATIYESFLRSDPRRESYIRIALVHHHPIPYKSRPTALYERLPIKIFGNDELFIAFNGSEEFLDWCGDRGVSLVLHGHKHIPHLAMKEMSDGSSITIVGCGSSVGAEDKPMCYDIVTIDSKTKRCSVSFYHDERGDGGAFKLQNVALDLRGS